MSENNAKIGSKKNKNGCGFKITIAGIIIAVILTLLVICIVKFFDYTSEQYKKISFPIKYSQIVEEMSEKYDVDQDLIYSVIKTESNFDAEAKSAVGALGLMQIMPTTFEWLQSYHDGVITMDKEELFVPEISIEYGTIFLKYLIDRYSEKSIDCVIAGYNAGAGAVDEWLADTKYSKDGITLDYIPYPETENYVEKVLIAMGEYEQILKE